MWDGVFDPFGEEVAITGLAAMPKRFPGQYADDETGYSYNRFRYYEPTLGRYIESDPIGVWGGINTYSYTRQSPLNGVDRLGLDTLVIINDSTSGQYSGDYGMTSSGNPFGHAAGAVTGSGVYSYGNNPDSPINSYTGSSVTDYVNKQSTRRDSTLYDISTTPEQEQRILQCFQSFNTTPNTYPDNCAARTNQCLREGGVRLIAGYVQGIEVPPGGLFPGDLQAAMENLVKDGQATRTEVPQNTPAPPSVAQFDPVSHGTGPR